MRGIASQGGGAENEADGKKEGSGKRAQIHLAGLS
jgi:hypothetical protein